MSDGGYFWATMRLLDHDPMDRSRSLYHVEDQGQDDDRSSSSGPGSNSHSSSSPDQEQDPSSRKETQAEDSDVEAPHGRFDPGHEYEPVTEEERTVVDEDDINPGVVLPSIECNEDVAAGRECLNTNCAIHHRHMGEDSDDSGCPNEGSECQDAAQEGVSGSELIGADDVEHHESEVDDPDGSEGQRDGDRDQVLGRESFTQHPANDIRVDQNGQEDDSDEASNADSSSDDKADGEYPDAPERSMAYATEQELLSDSVSERIAVASDDEYDHDDDEDDQKGPPRKKQKLVHAPAFEEQEHKYATGQEVDTKENKKKEEDDSGDDREDK